MCSLLKNFYQIHQLFEEDGITVVISNIKLKVRIWADEVSGNEVRQWNRSSIEFPFVFGSLKFNAKCYFESNHEEEDRYGIYLGVEAEVEMTRD